jgi:hypothetical protein
MMEMTNCNSSIFPCGFSQILKLIGTYIFYGGIANLVMELSLKA